MVYSYIVQTLPTYEYCAIAILYTFETVASILFCIKQINSELKCLHHPFEHFDTHKQIQ